MTFYQALKLPGTYQECMWGCGWVFHYLQMPVFRRLRGEGEGQSVLYSQSLASKAVHSVPLHLSSASCPPQDCNHTLYTANWRKWS